jgi:hypothetical protein
VTIITDSMDTPGNIPVRWSYFRWGRAVTLNRKDDEDIREVESSDRRQFLRTALQIGGAAALMLTATSRQVLAQSMALSPRDIDAARRAQQTPGAPPNAAHDAARMEASNMESSGGCMGCEGMCDGCEGGCKGCVGHCTGCSGINL